MSVQILGLRDFTDKLGKVRKTERFFEKNWRADSVAQIFEDPNSILKDIPESYHENLFFTVADCHEERGRKLKRQEILPFDIDDIDVSKQQETAQVCLASLGVNWDEVGVLFSGNGLQMFLGLKKAIENPKEFELLKPAYIGLCRKMQKALKERGLPGRVDVSVFSPGRLMRLPMTLNRKPGKEPRRAEILNHIIEPDLIELKFVDVDKGPPQDIPFDKNSLKKFPKPNTEAVLSSCSFLKHCKEKPKEVSEPEWYAMLSVLARLKNGKDLCHEYSKGHRGYSVDETNKKLEQSLKNSGPRTCEKINELWGNCKSCKYKGKVKSPVNIKTTNHVDSEPAGFWFLGDNGKPTFDMEGFIKHYNQTVTYRAIRGTKLMWQFDNKKWLPLYEQDLKNYVMHKPSKCPSMNIRNDFADRIRNDNLEDQEWLTKVEEGFINFSNGILDINKGELLDHSPEFSFKSVIPVDYHPDSVCPKWLAFLEDVTEGDHDAIKCLQEYFGYTISGCYPYAQKALILYGIGSNGKSIITKTLEAVCGSENVDAVSVKDLNTSPTARYSMIGKLLNTSSEAGVDAFQSSEEFKKIVDGDRVMVKALYSQEFPTALTCKLIIATNKPPTTRDKSLGTMRRFMPIHLSKVIKEEDQDLMLLDKLKKEIPGIINWSVRGYERLLSNGRKFTISAKQRAFAEDIQKQNDSVLEYFAEQYEVGSVDDEDYISSKRFREDYYGWCDSNRIKHCGPRQILKSLEIAAPNLEVKTRRLPQGVEKVYYGIKRRVY